MKNIFYFTLIIGFFVCSFKYGISQNIDFELIHYYRYQETKRKILFVRELELFSSGLQAVKYSENPVEKEGKWGYIDTTGRIRIDFQFDDASPFYDGLAVVKKKDKYGVINTHGEIILPITYNNNEIYYYGGSMIRVKKNDQWGYYGKTGKLKIDFQFERAGSFNDGIAWVSKNNKIGFIDTLGNLIIPYRYDKSSISLNTEFLIIKVKKGDKWGIINREGKVLADFIYDKIGSFGFYHDQKLINVKKDGKWGFIDRSGDLVTKYHFEDAEGGRNGFAAVKKNGKWGYIDKNGDMLVKCQFAEVNRFENDMAAVKKNGKWGFINSQGKLVIDCKYHDVRDFSDGLAPVSLNDKWGYINKNGDIITEIKHYRVSEFSNGIGVVYKLRDKTVMQVDSNRYSERVDRDISLINTKGEVIKDLSPNINNVSPFTSNGYSEVRKGAIGFIKKIEVERNNYLGDDISFDSATVFTKYKGTEIPIDTTKSDNKFVKKVTMTQNGIRFFGKDTLNVKFQFRRPVVSSDGYKYRGFTFPTTSNYKNETYYHSNFIFFINNNSEYYIKINYDVYQLDMSTLRIIE